MTLEVEGKEPEVIRCPVDINGFEYEIREASRCVKLGRTGSDRYTPQDSLALTRLMYDTRMSWGKMNLRARCKHTACTGAFGRAETMVYGERQLGIDIKRRTHR